MIEILKMHGDLYPLMEQALVEARKGLERYEVPIGAVVAGPDGDRGKSPQPAYHIKGSHRACRDPGFEVCWEIFQ